MAEETFPVLPGRKRAKLLTAAGLDLIALGAVALAVTGRGWGFWLLAVLLFAWSGFRIMSWARMAAVARVDDTGVAVWLPTGRQMKAGWAEIQGHTIDPARRLGGIVVKAGEGGRVRILPVATADMGPEAATRLIAAMKTRLPKLEYRVPTLRRG